MRRYNARWRDRQGTRYEQDMQLSGDETHIRASLVDHEAWVRSHTDVVWYGVVPVREIAADRDETDTCEALTPGCPVDHTRDGHPGCTTW